MDFLSLLKTSFMKKIRTTFSIVPFLDSSLQRRRRTSLLFSLNRRGLVQVEFHSGNSSAREWISRFKTGAAAEGLSPKDQLELFAILLTGKAAIWQNVFGSSLENIDYALNGLAKTFIDGWFLAKSVPLGTLIFL